MAALLAFVVKGRRIPRCSSMEYPRSLMLDFRDGLFLNCRTSPLLFSGMRHRFATSTDADILGELNHQLIRDEGHRNRMSIPELVARIKDWLANGYRVSIFEDDSGVLAYALYREEKDYLYLRQFFVLRHRRRNGVGRQCIEKLVTEIWPQDKRITVDVLCHNQAGIAFWRAVGFSDYCLTLERTPDQQTH
jgi:GNAT superfamily N-acetyltransferase